MGSPAPPLGLGRQELEKAVQAKRTLEKKVTSVTCREMCALTCREMCALRWEHDFNADAARDEATAHRGLGTLRYRT